MINRGVMMFVAAVVLFVSASCGAYEVQVPEPKLRVVLTFDDAIKDHLLIAAPELEARGWRGVFNIVTDWIGRGDRFLTWEDVRQLVRRGHEVTTHTVGHKDLVGLLKAGQTNEVRRQIDASRDLIAEKTGFAPRYMCAPFVRQNETTGRICREEGLRQMDVPRKNFGANNADGVAAAVSNAVAGGCRRLDILHHGISAAGHGGYLPFPDRASFARHLDAIAELERRGVLRVTDYDGCRSACALRSEKWPGHGLVAMSFDDCAIGEWESAFPVFAEYDASVTFCISGSFGSNVVAFARKALLNGHEIALHGLGHRNADVEFSKMGAERYWEAEIRPQLDACRKAGIPVYSFAYPNCRHTAEVNAWFSQKGFTRLRGSIPGVRSPNPYDRGEGKPSDWRPVAEADEFFDPVGSHLTNLTIPSIILGESYHTDISDILSAVDRAGWRGERLSLVSHGIAPGAKRINMKREWLERILARADASGVVVRGLR